LTKIIAARCDEFVERLVVGQPCGCRLQLRFTETAGVAASQRGKSAACPNRSHTGLCPQTTSHGRRAEVWRPWCRHGVWSGQSHRQRAQVDPRPLQVPAKGLSFSFSHSQSVGCVFITMRAVSVQIACYRFHRRRTSRVLSSLYFHVHWQLETTVIRYDIIVEFTVDSKAECD